MLVNTVARELVPLHHRATRTRIQDLKAGLGRRLLQNIFCTERTWPKRASGVFQTGSTTPLDVLRIQYYGTINIEWSPYYVCTYVRMMTSTPGIDKYLTRYDTALNRLKIAMKGLASSVSDWLSPINRLLALHPCPLCRVDNFMRRVYVTGKVTVHILWIAPNMVQQTQCLELYCFTSKIEQKSISYVRTQVDHLFQVQ